MKKNLQAGKIKVNKWQKVNMCVKDLNNFANNQKMNLWKENKN